MMATKARIHNEMGTHHSITMVPGQATIKRLERPMSNYSEDQWSQIRPTVLLAGNTRKFCQNSSLSSRLLLTSLSHLVEASATGAICGIGISVKDAYRGAKHRGRNLLGIALMEVRSSLLLHANQQKKRPKQHSLESAPSKKQIWVQCTHGAVRVAGSQEQPDGYDMERCDVPACVTEAKTWYSAHGSRLQSGGHGNRVTHVDAPTGVSGATPLCPLLPSTCSLCNSPKLLCDPRPCSECCFNSNCTCSAASHVQPSTTDSGRTAPAFAAQSAQAASAIGRPMPGIEVLLLSLSTKKGTVSLSNLGPPLSKSCVHTSTGNITQLAQSMGGGQRV